ncbi:MULTISPECIES: hypothetical protein [unclassified Rathayibacter]|uniref:hypothetical protein n=1 Tax=unclassified Rathayibacter TaxID=2609250 RepID=UPI000CE8A3E2|nr:MULTISPECIES: hypothetical protein [unclassified Rathayibacter]PPF16883.1 hypothetical protein C5B92_11055 [Rathayibacter sp. AY1A4]PPG80884.1 hypothetical protein C5C52_09755 [Rathayibacter sp. AY1E5]PPH30760.1 hypothetical protein C5C94_10100 [Rathayibacter sp. AY1C3]PPH51924.1 hypothetical protein C5D25_17460 [Rathayibacter sp. AY1D7]PPI26491.1 hypothetical protein C5D66_16620 [Rathayibacter sp. AY1B4]
MEAANLIVQLGLLVGTLGATAVTWIQAIIAVRANRAAGAAQEKAEEAARRAVSAAERSAAAEERAAAAAEERAAIERAREARRQPFEIQKDKDGVWHLWNRLEEIVTVTDLDGSENGEQYVQAYRGLPDHLKPGQALTFSFGGGLTDPASVGFTATYRLMSASGQDDQTWHTTLT